MSCISKSNELREIVYDRIIPLLSDKAILADAPYYNNIEDVLIWQGITDFLKDNSIRLLKTTSYNTFTFPELSDDVVILLMGGGNFGDLWRWFQEFRLRVIESYPNNRIIMFPQSVWYQDESLIQKDAEIMSKHKDLHLCARDQYSYDFMVRHFSSNDIILVPDMAFCINEERLIPYRSRSTDRKLFFKRIDKEMSESTPDCIGEDTEIHDWPTIERKPGILWWLGKMCGVAKRLKSMECLAALVYAAVDFMAFHYLRGKFVRTGCEFLAPYCKVITTRLHAMILSILLDKQVDYIDNTTGKLSAFADTWLNDIDTVTPYAKKSRL